MSDVHKSSGVIKWWAMIVVGTAAALLIAWLGHIAGVALSTVLSIGAGTAALAWLIVLVAVPWNLCFAARRVVVEMAVSRARGIVIGAAAEAEAQRIARRMLWFALGGHVVTAAVAALITYFSGATMGYYVTGAYLLSASIRPAAAYFAHLRERIGALSRQSLHPREDVVCLRQGVDQLADAVTGLKKDLPESHRGLAEDLRRTELRLTDQIEHAREMATADLARLQDAQAGDRETGRSGDEELGRRIDRMIRRIEETLDGIGDHQELQAGIRALVRMIRAEPSSPT